jgi:anti-sigma B factor antagonist
MPLTFRLSSAEVADGAYVVTVSGEADALAAPTLQETLDDVMDEGAREVIIDLLRVPFLDSSILGVLVRTARRLRSSGGDVVLVSDDARLLRTFEISGLITSFRFERSLADAVDRALTSAVDR